MNSVPHKTVYQNGRKIFLLHTLVNTFSSSLIKYLRRKGCPTKHRKIDNVLRGGDTIEAVEHTMGLAHREIMCTLARADSAVYYHNYYGLIMDGGIRICYDDGSHLAYGDAGRYEGTPDELANETDIQSIADNYDEIHAGDPFKWTEAILHPGAHIVGAFIDRGIIDNRETVERFLARCAELRLPILEVRGMVFGDESGV